MAVELVYRYPAPSRLALADGHADLRLATSGGSTATGAAEHPHFFDGEVAHADQTAVALLAVARVARTRFWTPPGMVAAAIRAADPVVTSDGRNLRFESFSLCCGVHARLDVLPGGLAAAAVTTGTTNVDVNPPLRAALAQVARGDALRLAVGEDLAVTTAAGTVVEERVPLPGRWLKGFAEVQVAGAGMVPAWEVGGAAARTFVRGLPRGTTRVGTVLWAVPSAAAVRLTSRPAKDAVAVVGADRLRVLEPLLRFAAGLRAYAPAGADPGRPTATTWELAMPEARLVLTLSPDVGRGFSGEGGVLIDLADPRTGDDADLVGAALAHEPRVDVLDLHRRTGLPHDRVVRALTRLGAAGRVGYDAHAGAFFHRELPYDQEALDALHPRLLDARALVDAGAVSPADDGGVHRVRSGEVEHAVRAVADGYRCTCPWYGRHGGDRGPCKHVLAVRLLAGRT